MKLIRAGAKNPIRTTEQTGFTIVELLIVVVVIAILSTITIVSYNGITENARVAAMSDGIKQIDKSFRLWIVDEGLTVWPEDPIAGGGVPFSEMIADNPGLQRYMQTVPSVPGINTDEWFYDNDNDSRTSCGDAYAGVNVSIRYLSNQRIAQKVDTQIDDGNLNCGKVRYTASGILFYSLSYDPNNTNAQ